MGEKIKKQVRDRWLTIRLSQAEEKFLKDFSDKTTCNNLSNYARNVLLRKPVTLLYRNQSQDNFLNELILLKRELNAIGNNFNQLVHRLHIIDHQSELKSWIISYELQQQTIQSKTNEIKTWLVNIYNLWSQE